MYWEGNVVGWSVSVAWELLDVGLYWGTPYCSLGNLVLTVLTSVVTSINNRLALISQHRYNINILKKWAIFLKKTFVYLCLYIYLYHMCDWYLKRSEESIGSSEPQPIMSHCVRVQVLGTEPKSSVKSTSALNHLPRPPNRFFLAFYFFLNEP